MSATNEERAFNEALLVRVRELREARDLSPDEMARALGVPIERYRKYEQRSPLPQYLIPRFAVVVGRSIEHVLTGREASGRREKPVAQPDVRSAADALMSHVSGLFERFPELRERVAKDIARTPDQDTSSNGTLSDSATHRAAPPRKRRPSSPEVP